MIKLPKPLEELNTSIARSKDLLARLGNGQEYIQKAHADKSIAKIFEAAILYNKLAQELNEELEHALFMHETITTGKTVLLNRKGKPINIDDYIKGETQPVDAWTLQSVQKMEEVFGKDAIVDVEFE